MHAHRYYTTVLLSLKLDK